MSHKHSDNPRETAAEARRMTQHLKGYTSRVFRRAAIGDLLFTAATFGIVFSSAPNLLLSIPIASYYIATSYLLRKNNLAIKEDFNAFAANFPRDINTDLKPLRDRMKTIWSFGKQDIDLIKQDMFGHPLSIALTVFVGVTMPLLLPLLAASTIVAKDRAELLKLSHAAEMAGNNIKERYPSRP